MENLMTAKQAAEVLNIHRYRLYRLVRDEMVPVVRIGRALRFRPEELDAWLRHHSARQKAPDRGK